MTMPQKNMIPTLSRRSLPSDLQTAIINVKNRLTLARAAQMAGQGTGLTPFHNQKGPRAGQGPSPLPNLSNGCAYYEFDVGQGRDNRGSRRVVAEVVDSTLQVRELYFTDDHYTKGSFSRLVD
jgi:guanyl-specific ribonuclease Sa